ncbi:MAG: serine/threonine-protein kinase [Phycisphaerales bacterium]
MAEHRPEEPRTAPTLADSPPTSDGSSASNKGSNAGTAATGEGSGSQIGPYKLLQLIGEGGFGSVFMAEQQAPVVRTVAFKIIKLGMDTRQVIARFAAERQALAVMDHPNIARIFDAGATAAGRPYFVMELCKGDPISTYCDRRNLTISDRLELFEQVCRAVQHAHTKGIIHRDLKPSNILVSSQDGKPFAKVIDFGIAKATDDRLAERTMFTEHRQLIGTVEYMSPEQAEGSVDIDTRTDVYSLGVLLYELLTGSTPFSSKELRSAAHGEIQRIIREVDPPPPSDRLSRSGDTLASVAASRQVQPGRLGSLVRGELDWIVMKAMEKDRPRRYESASGLAADVRRYLDGEAVLAAPPGRAYRLGKVIRRNKGAVAAAAAVASALTIGLVAFAWQAQVARGQRDRAVAAEAEAKRRADDVQLVSDFQGRMLRQIDANAAGERLWGDLRERFAKALETAGIPEAERESQVAAFDRDLSRINATDGAAAMIDRTILMPSIKAIELEFQGQPVLGATLRSSIAQIYQQLGLNTQALALATDAAETFGRALGEDDARTITAGLLQADLLQEAGRLDESAALQRALLARSIRVHGAEHAETLATMGNLGNVLRQQNKFAEAELLLRQALEGRRRTLGDSHRETLTALNTYGALLIAQGKVADTEPYWREAYETGRRALGPDDPDVLIWTANMGGLLSELGKWEDAAGRYREASEGFRRVRGEEHPYTLGCMKGLGAALNRMGRFDEAERVFVGVLAARFRAGRRGSQHPRRWRSSRCLYCATREAR